MTQTDLFRNAFNDFDLPFEVYFDAAKWNDEFETLLSKNLSHELQSQKYPLVFLLYDPEWTYNNNDNIVTCSPIVYIFGVTELNKKDLWRMDNEFPTLIEIEEELYKCLEENGAEFENIDGRHLTYDYTKDNQLADNLNAIYLQFTNLEFDRNTCTI